jgi:hypothetical protein
MASADGIVIGRHASPLLVAVSGPEVVATFGAVAAGRSWSCVAVVGFGVGFGAVVDVVVVAGVVGAVVVGLAPVVVPVVAVAVVGVEVVVVADALGDEASLAVLLEPQPLSTKTKHAI